MNLTTLSSDETNASHTNYSPSKHLENQIDKFPPNIPTVSPIKDNKENKKNSVNLESGTINKRKSALKKIVIIDYEGQRQNNKMNIINKKANISSDRLSPKSNGFESRNNAKITDFFIKKHEINHKIEDDNNNNQKQMEISQKIKREEKPKTSSTDTSLMKEELRKLNKIITDKDNIIKEKGNKVKELETLIGGLKGDVSFYQNSLYFVSVKSKENIIKLLVETEELRKKDLIAELYSQKQKLGDYGARREGQQFIDVWIDGYGIREIKEKLKNIQKEIEELEKKKKLLGYKNSTSTLNAFKKNNIESCSMDCNEEDLTPKVELKSHINFQIFMIQREEQKLLEQLMSLDKERNIFINKWRRFQDEQCCRFAQKNLEFNMPAWPLLNDRYQVLSLLGKGGFSEVYKAYDIKEFRDVACKIHQLDPGWSKNYKEQYIKHALRETQIHLSLNHPNVVKLYETFELDPNTLCTVLEYCDGNDLAIMLKENNKILSEKEAKFMIREMMLGLRYLHEHKRKIIHYDLKPHNILFHRGQLKISDFGLCKVLDSNTTKCELTSQGVGTYWYLPPECFVYGEKPPIINTSLDVWSVGVIFYEMIFGEKPFGNNMSQNKILKDQIILYAEQVKFPEKKNVSDGAKEFIKKCLVKVVDKRWSAREALESNYLKKI